MMKQFNFNGILINYVLDKDGLFLCVNDINKVLGTSLRINNAFIHFKHLPFHLDLSNVINVTFINTARGMIVEYVYIMSTDVEGVYKVGYSKNDLNNRVKSLQTGSVKSIRVLEAYSTPNGKLLESVVHYLLSDFRVNKREFFKCNLDYIKNTIKTAANLINYNVDVSCAVQESQSATPMEGVEASEESRFMDWLRDNVVYEENKILKLANIIELYFKGAVSTKVASIYKKLVCKHLAERFPSMDTTHKDTSFKGKNFKGWLHFSLCN